MEKYSVLLKEKAIMYGETTLADNELLSLLLGGKEVLANLLLSSVDNMRHLSTLSIRELQKVEGIGPSTALRIKACLEIARRFHRVTLKTGALLNNSQQVFAHYHEKLRDLKREKFFSLLLDCKNRIIREELVSIGGLNFSVVHPREVFAPAIKESAAGIILIHNHPSGDPTASHEDIQITKRLVEVGKVIGIEVVDHVIIGKSCYISFSEQKLL